MCRQLPRPFPQQFTAPFQAQNSDDSTPAGVDASPTDLVALRKDLASFVAPLARRMGFHHEAEDFVQEALCRLLERQARRLPTPLAAVSPAARKYLRMVARSVVCDRLRVRHAAKRQLEASRRVPLEAVEELLPDGRRDPEQRLLAREHATRSIAAWRNALPRRRHRARDLRILVQAWFEGRTSRQISTALGGHPTAANVDALLHRVRRRLRLSGEEAPLRYRAAPAADLAGS